MDDYQKSVVAQFFQPLPNLSQESCHQFVLERIAPTLLPETKAHVEPSPFQGSTSYTTILSTSGSNQRLVVQFRLEEQDLFGVTEANNIHGALVPPVVYRGVYEDLFVYTSPFAKGTPYISVLTSSPDFDLSIDQKKTTTVDLANITTRKARASATTISSFRFDDILSTANDYAFHIPSLQARISTCIDKLLAHLHHLSALPIVLTHQDLGPFNYLVEESTCRIQTVLDWDGARYLPIGSNFHFMEILFGFMTPDGWVDSDDRQELEAAFYAQVLASLAAQGFEGVSKEQLELQKAIGMLEFYVARLVKLKDQRTEQYLDGYLQRLSFMH